MSAAALCLFWLVVALAAPWLAPYDPIAQDLKATLQPPNAAHLLGTDNFGRDILSRIIWGTRLDLQMGVFGVFFPFVIGTTIGVASGYLGGLVDVAGDAPPRRHHRLSLPGADHRHRRRARARAA